MNDNYRTRKYWTDLTNMEQNTLFGITLFKEKPYICFFNKQSVFFDKQKDEKKKYQ